MRYGYKKHIATENEGLITAVYTTTADEHDSKGLNPLLKKAQKKSLKKVVFVDKGYKVPANDSNLNENKIKYRIQHKSYGNRNFTERQIKFNKLISQDRCMVESTFGGMKRWFKVGMARYVGIEKTHTQHVMEAIA